VAVNEAKQLLCKRRRRTDVEMAQHAQLRIDADLDIYFCDP